MLGKKVFEYGLGRPLANRSFNFMHRQIHAIQRSGISMMHTARPFSFYRKVFYRGASEADVLAQLSDQCVVDIGCGYTPYADDSLFQACHNAGIEFYGVDPVIREDIRFNFKDRLLARALGGSGRLQSASPGVHNALCASAHNLPLMDESVDQILCSYLLFVWIEHELELADILAEFLRVLKPGGTTKLYPMPEWQCLHIQEPRLQEILARYEIEQALIPGDLSARIGPSMLTELTKYHY